MILGALVLQKEFNKCLFLMKKNHNHISSSTKQKNDDNTRYFIGIVWILLKKILRNTAMEI